MVEAVTIPKTAPLVQMRPHQVEPFWREDLGLIYLSWRRRAGKSHCMASKAIRRGMARPGLLSVFISASILLGAEFIRKEFEVWSDVHAKMRTLAAAQQKTVTSTTDGLDIDAFCDVFQHGKLETKIWHDRTTCSRSLVVAPNVNAVGYGGDVYFDEVGRMPNFQELMEAAEPIMQDKPEYRWMMATTISPDDAHYSRDLSLPPQEEFPVRAAGNWYESQAGVMVHRFDVYDGELAGLKLYDRTTRRVLTPAEHRAQAFDKAAWDRNYAMKFLAGGAAAIPSMQLDIAMRLGQDAGALFVDCQEAIEL